MALQAIVLLGIAMLVHADSCSIKFCKLSRVAVHVLPSTGFSKPYRSQL